MFLLYLDPGSGSFLFQLAVAALAGLGIAVGANWAKLKRWISRKKNKNETNNEDDDQPPGA